MSLSCCIFFEMSVREDQVFQVSVVGLIIVREWRNIIFFLCALLFHVLHRVLAVVGLEGFKFVTPGFVSV